MKKFHNVGFEDIRVVGRKPFGLHDLRRYPLFAPEFIDFLERALPERRHGELVSSIAVTGRKPQGGPPPGS